MGGSTPVYWRNHLVGYASDIEIDMWYQSGKWQSAQAEIVAEFYKVLETLIPIQSLRDINTNLEKEIWVGLGVNKPTHLIYAFNTERIDMRITASIKPKNW